MGFYSDMDAMVQDLLLPDTQGGLGQGTIVLRRVVPGTPDPDEPWVPVAPTTTNYTLKGVAKRLHQRYEGGALIVETGDMVTFAVPTVTPTLATDKIVIDGVERVMTNLKSIPAAGTPVAYQAWCAL